MRRKKNRKTENCLNCQSALKTEYDYCPVCGQENKDNYISIWTLLREFFSNYFSVDSRFGRTWIPFLFKPGKITIEFNEGKRVKYANPIRLYLVISLVHFFLLSQVSDYMDDPDSKVFKVTQTEDNQDEDSVAYEIPDENVTPVEDQDSTFGVSDEEFEKLIDLSYVDSLNEDEILDSLEFNERPFITRLTARQFVRLTKSPASDLNRYVLQKIPIMMFFLLPIYALLLKLFYWRKGLYIKHLIHSIHIHSILFLLLSLTWLLGIFNFEYLNELTITILFTVFIYIFLSFKRVYRQGWFITFFKILGIGILYQLNLILFFTVEILISLLFF